MGASAADASLYVQVKNSKLRSQPQMWAASVSDLVYGEKLIPLTGDSASTEGWVKVKTSNGKSGFVHVSAITQKEIVLASRQGVSRNAVDSSDIVLAGKGFNHQVEDEYARSHDLDYSAVNQAEKNRVDSGEVASFLKNGKLQGGK